MLTALGVAASMLFTLGASSCAGGRVTVKALARGATNSSPFFRAAGLAVDLIGTISALEGGSKSGATPGLYGGTRRKSSCDKGQLIKYLKENGEKAAAWAEVRGIGMQQIESYVDKLTPVLLRNDTLVENYDYDTRKKEPTPFYALLEAGVAVLIDAYGLPVVQCRCGNPLRRFDMPRDDVEVDFDADRVAGNKRGKGEKGKEWKGFDRKRIVKVEPAEKKLDAVLLVEHTEDGETKGLERPPGTSGEQDQVLKVDPGTEENAEVPDVVGKPADEAEASLREAGFGVETAAAGQGEAESAGPGRVVRQDPEPGTVALRGMTVTLYRAEEAGRPEAACAEVGVDFGAYDPLERGSTGALVGAAQCLLMAAGYDPGPVDGEFGEMTAAAALSLQSDHGLQTLGVVGPKTWTVLLSRGDTPEVRAGANGEAVTRLQRALTAALGETVVIDGDFGPATENAVRSYQSSRGLESDGVVGPQTWAALQAGR
ncbi:peptidoglycan-binding protein [Streptomyces actuosus]|uniref:Peptidoglycan-binding protein n=1 Tax=Streptomyces actuosus TaxID=1885 RepID=A0ABS2VHI1_STRAS|nr:DUF6777 domain-containing protein [Streptomyces actuosus]MBN0042531.1 peptidoglycan-binding protein [Streptomyces actuosus]